MHGASIHTSQFSVPDCLVPVSSTPFPLSICMFVCFWMPAVMDVDRTLVIVHSACRFSVLMTPLACPGWPNFHSSACVFPSFSHPPNRAELSTIAISRLLDLIEISGDGWSLEGVPVFGCPGISIVLLPGSPIPANIHILCIVLSLPLLDRCLTSVSSWPSTCCWHLRRQLDLEETCIALTQGAEYLSREMQARLNSVCPVLPSSPDSACLVDQCRLHLF